MERTSRMETSIMSAIDRIGEEGARELSEARLSGDERRVSLAQLKVSLAAPNGMLRVVAKMPSERYALLLEDMRGRIGALRKREDFDGADIIQEQMALCERARNGGDEA